MAKEFRILSIDGGGIRGLIPAIVLAELETRVGKPTSSMFDLIVGTSTGGIIALGLTRAWELLGAHRYGFGGWLNPLQDVHDEASS